MTRAGIMYTTDDAGVDRCFHCYQPVEVEEIVEDRRSFDWVNSDLMRIAHDLEEQAKETPENTYENNQNIARLIRAAAHLKLAFAELVEITGK